MNKISLIILGTVQDAGSPHIGCSSPCCKKLFTNPDKTRKIVSLGSIDPDYNKTFLFEATPDISTQIKMLHNYLPSKENEMVNGIFITHAHIGHYTGLMYLGKEALNTQEIPVYVLPKMKLFIEENGPWNQLLFNKNIIINTLLENSKMLLTSNISIIPFTVPHRNEYSETCGYKILGPNKSILFIPDIDKWTLWNNNLMKEIMSVDVAFIDGTFYSSNEIINRNINEIPHPLIIETMSSLKSLSKKEKGKIHFIHFNHTNPLLEKKSNEYKNVLVKGYNIAKMNDVIHL